MPQTLQEPSPQPAEQEELDISRPSRAYATCLHVTAAEHLPSILASGLLPRVGPLSQRLEEPPAIWMFPYWECIEDANWLWDNWPYASEPALLAVDTRGLDLQTDVYYEVAAFEAIEPSRIRVLSPTEMNWKKEDFFALGGLPSAKTDPQCA
jgi:hypothetical protein